MSQAAIVGLIAVSVVVMAGLITSVACVRLEPDRGNYLGLAVVFMVIVTFFGPLLVYIMTK